MLGSTSSGIELVCSPGGLSLLALDFMPGTLLMYSLSHGSKQRMRDVCHDARNDVLEVRAVTRHEGAAYMLF